jgi:glutathione S-transferase
MKPLLYGIGVSPYVRKVRFILAFKGIDYNFEPILPGQGPDDYSEFSPLNKIPALTCGDFAISDSSVIAQYLERKFADQSIFPTRDEDYARTLWLEEYADSRMTEILVGIFFNKIAKPLVFKVPADMEKVAELEARLPEVFDYLEKQVTNKQYLVDDSISLADFSVISVLQNFVLAGYKVDAERWPETSRYYLGLLEHAAINSVLEKEAAELAQMA